MSAEHSSGFEHQPGPAPEVIIPDIEQVRDSFRAYPSDYQLEKTMHVLESTQMAQLEPSVRAEQIEVLSQGTLRGREIGMPEVLRSAQGEIAERHYIAKLLIQSPETAEVLVENAVAGFHATNSYSLAGIIESGAMYSGIELHEQGKAANGTGDAALNGKGQTTISFGVMHSVERNTSTWSKGEKTCSDEEVRKQLAEDVDSARQLLSEMEPGSRGEPKMKAALHNAALMLKNYKQNPNSLASTMLRHRFPVVVGVSTDFVRISEETREKGNILIGEPYFGEFRPNAQEIPLDVLPVIGVPNQHVKNVTELLAMFSHDKTQVVALEDLLEVA